MCETITKPIMSLVRDHLLPLVNMIKGIPKEVADLKVELERIENSINGADHRMAEAEEDSACQEIKAWLKQLTEVAFCIEDVIDEYMIWEGQDPVRDPGCAAAAELVKPVILRFQIAYKIQNIKSRIGGMKDTSGRYGSQIQSSSEQGPNSSTANQNTASWQKLREAPLYMDDEDDVVGFDSLKAELIGWLVNGRAKRTVISVVGMGGLGKTTLAKKVFDSKEVTTGYFECYAWITVSPSYTVEGLMRDMLHKFYKQKGDDLPQHISGMDQRSLIEKMRNYLQQKRYVVVFDDVWNVHFWDEIGFALIDNKNGSRILITTRNKDVAMSCQKSSFVKVHELQPLTPEHSLKLFNKKTFQYDFDGCCPKDLIDISLDIVNKCKGLPLAIVAIGGLLSTKEKNAIEWQRFSQNLPSELENDSILLGINRILSLSYNDLPYNLKSCFLYFGMYPEDYVVKSKRLIRQWRAEGFVKEERGKTKTLEEVAEGYLKELIRRSLVQVSSISIDGKAKGCRVHDLIRVMILEKFEDLSFCHHIGENCMSSLSGIIRRLSIATSSGDLMATNIESPYVRSLLVSTQTKLSEYFMRRITTTYKLLKVLDFEEAGGLLNVFGDLGSLIHLKYLSFKNTSVSKLPKSIGMLQSLETLDLRATPIYEMPKEISKLRKLRHLLGNEMSLIQLKDGIGGMTSLQTLCDVELDGDGVAALIKELGKLKQLRELGLVDVRGEHGGALSSSINKMRHLEKLHIMSKSKDEVIDLHLISALPMLQNLRLEAKLEKLPEWIINLQSLVKLNLAYSQLADDPMKLLKNMSNLLSLSITDHAYKGESLHFLKDGGFQKLKELYLENLDLESITIEKGALHSLKKLKVWEMPKLKTVPTTIKLLEKLDALTIGNMPAGFLQKFIPYDGGNQGILRHLKTLQLSNVNVSQILTTPSIPHLKERELPNWFRMPIVFDKSIAIEEEPENPPPSSMWTSKAHFIRHSRS